MGSEGADGGTCERWWGAGQEDDGPVSEKRGIEYKNVDLRFGSII